LNINAFYLLKVIDYLFESTYQFMKVVKQARIICILLIVSLLQSCDEVVIAPPKKNNKVNLTAPANRLITPNHSQSFYWTSISGTEAYQLQISTPDFSSNSQLIVDTILSATTVNITLPPGFYEWCVNALNPGSNIIPSDTSTLTIH
jgi:hypothetical protein